MTINYDICNFGRVVVSSCYQYRLKIGFVIALKALIFKRKCRAVSDPAFVIQSVSCYIYILIIIAVIIVIIRGSNQKPVEYGP